MCLVVHSMSIPLTCYPLKGCKERRNSDTKVLREFICIQSLALSSGGFLQDRFEKESTCIFCLAVLQEVNANKAIRCHLHKCNHNRTQSFYRNKSVSETVPRIALTSSVRCFWRSFFLPLAIYRFEYTCANLLSGKSGLFSLNFIIIFLDIKSWIQFHNRDMRTFFIANGDGKQPLSVSYTK